MGLARRIERRNALKVGQLKKNTRGKPKGRARVQSVHDENHATLFTHMPTVSFKDIKEKDMPEAKPSCRHCWGTGSPGSASISSSKRELTCACVVRKISELGLLEKKDNAEQDEKPASD